MYIKAAVFAITYVRSVLFFLEFCNSCALLLFPQCKLVGQLTH